MKKELAGRFLTLLLLCLGLCIGYRHYTLSRVMGARVPETALAPMVMVEGTVWQVSDNTDRGIGGTPDGTIRKIIENEIPREDGQANFGTEGMPYWHLPEGLMVCVNGNYLILTNMQE